MCRHCWQPIHIFPLSYKLPTPVFCKLWFHRNLSNKTTPLFYMHLHTYLISRFHDCKRENVGFRSHIKNVIRLLWSLFSLCSLHFQFTYRYTIGKDSKILYSFGINVVNMISISLRLWWFVKECDPTVGLLVAWCLIEFVMHWWFNLYVL